MIAKTTRTGTRAQMGTLEHQKKSPERRYRFFVPPNNMLRRQNRSPLDAEIIKLPALPPDFRESWKRFVALSGFRNPLNDPQYIDDLGAAGLDIEILVGKQNNNPLVFIPFQRLPGNRAVSPAIPITDCSQISCAPNLRFSPCELLNQVGIRSLAFDHLFEQEAFECARYVYAEDCCYLIDLKNGFQEYRNALRVKSRNLLSEIGRKTKKLEREQGDVRFRMNVPDNQLVRQLLDWKIAELNRKRFSHALDQDWVGRFIRKHLQSTDSCCNGLLSVLYAADVPVAMQLGTRGYGVVNSWIPVINPAYARYSPALVMFHKMAFEAANSGIRTIILGRGVNQTKRRIANRIVPNYEGIFSSGGVLQTAKMWGLRRIYGFFRSPWGNAVRQSLRKLRKQAAAN